MIKLIRDLKTFRGEGGGGGENRPFTTHSVTAGLKQMNYALRLYLKSTVFIS